MKFLAISGSVRLGSSNTALLSALAEIAPPGVEIYLYDGLQQLPIFSPDLEGDQTPDNVTSFCAAVRRADGIIISSPEYVHAIPGGLKNAIDWLVSRDEIIFKPIVLLHASHRGDDMLASLRLVLRTVSQNFNEEIFARFALMTKSPEEVRVLLAEPANVTRMAEFISKFRNFVGRRENLP